jgi:hypothetical protein
MAVLLAGCESGEEAPAQEGAGSPALPPAAAGASASPAADAARAEERARAALAVILVDPKSARYSEVRRGTAGSVCGRVDSKQADGKYAGARPFVVTPEGVAVVSAAPRVVFDDPEDVFPDFYIRWCASPEELRTIGPSVALSDRLETGLEAGNIAGLDGIIAPEIPPSPEAPVAVGEAPPASKADAPRSPAAGANQGAREEDSFARAVLRKEESGAAKD